MEYAKIWVSFTYILAWFHSFFLRRLHVMLLELCLCVVIFKTNVLKAQSHFTLTALPEHFSCHTSSLTDTTPQLRLRRGRPMFAAADFKPSDTLFNLGGLPNGLGTLRSGPACASIFLTGVNRKSMWYLLTSTRGMKDIAIENGQI